MSEDRIFRPLRIRGVTLPNRLGVAPMTRMSSVADSIPRPDVLDFLVRRARKGAGLVTTEAIVSDYESAQGYPGQARLTTQRQIDAWKRVTDDIRAAGAVSAVQVFHCGRMAWPAVNPAGRSVAPSALTPKQLNPVTGEPYPVPDVMSRFDIEHAVAGFVETAKGAAAAGFDAFEIHAAHGYLHSQFLSRYSNRREDEYGGSLENRYRILHETVSAVSSVLPPHMLLFVRVSNWGVADMDVSLFDSADEWRDLVGLIDQEPVDAISVSTYEYGADAFGTGKPMAALTREATDKPLFICGSIHDRTTAEDALRHADVALAGKSFLLDPEWVEGVREGRPLKRYHAKDADVAYTSEPLP